MGNKTNARGFRIGITESWRSRWFATGKDFARYLAEDRKIRHHVKERLSQAGIAKIEVERAATKVLVKIHTAKPGLVIGKKGKDIEDLRATLRNLVGREVSLNIVETRKPDIDGQLVAETIAFQIERRVSYRRAVKEAISKALRMGAEGVKVGVSGRLGGVDIARAERYLEGRVPLHTLRADVDFGFAEARSAMGAIGVKVWIFKGERYSPGEEMPAEAIQI